jgi:hypothetical protein
MQWPMPHSPAVEGRVMSRASLFWTLLACAVLAAVTAAADLADDQPSDKGNESAKQFHEQLLEIAKTYKRLGHVDFEARWAPGLCRAPRPGLDYTPAKARLSDSKDTETHGRKLYFLFAKDRPGYLALTAEKSDKPAARQARGAEFTGPKYLPEKLQALQQFVVKESWTPVEVDKERRELARDNQEYVDPYASRDGKLYKTGEQRDLFIIVKLDAKTPATDNGWVYGTVTADAKKVTSAGRVESCMGCHKNAKHDRLFGLAKPEAAEKSEKPEQEKR